ncbi:hypothetical protein [Niallia circulans]|uniref:hypothetical protein n=1 Tax=Niallia circulans TaxID=1397 RepID=UPI00201DF032|nr:hypothetical protein [Niallia circulans]
MHQNIREKQSNKSSFLGVLSILFPIVLGLLILNFFTDIIPLEKIQGLPVLMPLFVCPIGAVIGFLGYKRSRRYPIISRYNCQCSIVFVPCFLPHTRHAYNGKLI